MDAASLLLGLLLGALLGHRRHARGGRADRRAAGRRAPRWSPLHESLDHLHRLLAGMERARATAHGELREQMGTVGQASAQLRSRRRRRWSRRCAPRTCAAAGARCSCGAWSRSAGLLEHCDFVEQPTVTATEAAGVRPDLVVTWPRAAGRGRCQGAVHRLHRGGAGPRRPARAAAGRRPRPPVRAHIDALAARKYPRVRPAARSPSCSSPPTRSCSTRWRPSRRCSSTASPATSCSPPRARCWRCCARSRTPGGRTGWPATPTRCSRSAAGCTPGSAPSGHLTRLGSALGTHVGRATTTPSAPRAVGARHRPPVRRRSASPAAPVRSGAGRGDRAGAAPGRPPRPKPATTGRRRGTSDQRGVRRRHGDSWSAPPGPSRPFARDDTEGQLPTLTERDRPTRRSARLRLVLPPGTARLVTVPPDGDRTGRRGRDGRARVHHERSRRLAADRPIRRPAAAPPARPA